MEDLGEAPELILDLGAGQSPWALQVRHDELYQARVVRLDPGYADPARFTLDSVNAVAATAQALPFGDDKFDRVVSTSMLMYLTVEQALAVTAECLRVVRPGGVINFHPSYRMEKEAPGLLTQTQVRGGITTNLIKPQKYNWLAPESKEALARAVASLVAGPERFRRLTATSAFGLLVQSFTALPSQYKGLHRER